MTNLFELEYDKNYQQGKEFLDGNNRERLYLKRSYSKAEKRDFYFLNLYTITDSGDMLCQGYMYFTLTFLEKKSKFMGVYVRPDCRNSGYASFLIANWIKLCLDNDIYDLRTNKKQRKPFTLHLLKKYAFDLANLEEYNTSPYVVHICRDLSNNFKYLLFDSQKQKEGFAHGTIIRGDNYRIIDCMTDGIEEIDKVILSRPHLLKSANDSYVKSLQYIRRKTEK